MRRRLILLSVIAAGVAALLLVPLAAAVAPVLIVPQQPITVEATGPAGATVTYSVSATDDPGDPAPAITCSHGSGTTFPLGTTTVTCTATDNENESTTDSFDVTVRDTTAPQLAALPVVATVAATSAAGAVVTYATPSATDVVDTSPNVGCSPASGSTFAIGSTQVTCTATDAAGNSRSASFTVTVADTTPPVLTVPANITAEASGPGGAAVAFNATATDWTAVSVSCSPPPGSTFPVSTTTVTCTATDSAGNASPPGSFTVTVTDSAPPSISLPDPVVAEATSLSGAAVSYPAPTASDLVDASPNVACAPSSGSTFPLGVTTVQCTATDDAGNSATGSFGVTVQDTTPPTVTVPSTVTAEANGPAGSAVSYVVSASDLGTPLLPGATSCSRASGAIFPIGETTVTCEAGDGRGNVGAASFVVTVQDTTPPTLNATGATFAATNAAGISRNAPPVAAYLRGFTAFDLVGVTSIRSTAPEVFPVGETKMAVTAADAAGNQTRKTVTVTVLPPGSPAPPPPDQKPPADVTRVRTVAGDHTVTLSWVNPAQDVALVEIRMSTAGGPQAGRVVYRGLRSPQVIKKLRNDVEHRFVLTSVDAAGNRSEGIVALATPKALLLAAPKPGARVTTAPLLRWAPVGGASYFNVQLYKGKVKVLSVWPTKARFKMKLRWVYEKKKRSLTPGKYTWYVWPGLGSRAEARYGPLLGRSTFVYAKPKKKPAAKKQPAKKTGSSATG
jgi:hypothetical protein